MALATAVFLRVFGGYQFADYRDDYLDKKNEEKVGTLFVGDKIVNARMK